MRRRKRGLLHQRSCLNEATCALTGSSRKALTGFRAGELAADDSSRQIYENVMQGRKLRGRKQVRRKDGNVVDCRYWALPTTVAKLPYQQMAERIGDGTLETVIEACRASRAPCDRCLEWLSHQDEHERQLPFDTLRCVGLLSVIADRLELDRDRPLSLIDATIELARELPQDAFDCAVTCRAAANALSEWLNDGYEHH